MDNIRFYAVIHYLCLNGRQVHEVMGARLGEGATFYSTVKKWDAELKCGGEMWLHEGQNGNTAKVIYYKLSAQSIRELNYMLYVKCRKWETRGSALSNKAILAVLSHPVT